MLVCTTKIPMGAPCMHTVVVIMGIYMYTSPLLSPMIEFVFVHLPYFTLLIDFFFLHLAAARNKPAQQV